MVEYRILAVDDDPVSLEAIVDLLRDDGHEVHAATTAEEAEDLIRRQAYDLVVTDLILPGRSGIDLVGAVRATLPQTPVLVVTGHATLRSAIEALKAGALDYLTKPLDGQQLRGLVAKALRERGSTGAFGSNGSAATFDGMVSRSPAMQAVFERILLAAGNESPVLLQGESGTGKESSARSIHARSSRARGPFVTLRAGALSHDRVHSELFGEPESGIPGKWEQAQGGILFLEEIDALDLPAQEALLHLLETGRGEKPGPDVRLIASTHRSLAALVRDGRFREDLFYRISILTIELPPLRERQEDLPLLVSGFLDFLSARYRKAVPQLPDETMNLLSRHGWPGNVRELRNVIEHAVILCRDGRLDPELLPHSLRSDRLSAEPIRIHIGTKMKEVERTVIARTLDACQWNKNKTAKVLGISRRSLYNKLERYRISREAPREVAPATVHSLGARTRAEAER